MYRPVRNESVEILYRVEGHGEPLVLLHGFTDNSEAWREYGFTQPLLAAGRRLIMIDARGHCRSKRRGVGQELGAQDEWRDPVQYAKGGLPANLGIEPQRASPGAVGSVFAAEQYRGSRDLRAFCG